MALLEELGKKFSVASRVVARKAKEVTDIGGLKIQIADENRKLNKLYETLGREYFELFKDQAHEELEDTVDQVKGSIQKISELQEEINRVEEESALKAEQERLLREAEEASRREAVADAEMREVQEAAEADSEAEAEGGENAESAAEAEGAENVESAAEEDSVAAEAEIDESDAPQR